MTNPVLSISAAGLALTASLCPAAVSAEPDVYGKLMLGVEHIDDESESGDYWEVGSYASRFGIKGGADTDTAGLEVVYKLEWQVDVTDAKDSSDDHIKGRNQFVGLAGGFGRFIIGRHDTPFKDAMDDIDLYNDIVDVKRLMAGGENRVNNMYEYTSPELADRVTVRLMGVPGEDPAAGEDGPADGVSTSVRYRQDGLKLVAAFDSGIEGPDTDGARLTAGWSGESFGIGGLVQTSDWNTGTNEEVVFAGGYYTLDKLTFKLQTGSASNYGGITDRDADLTTAGIDFSLSDKTTLGGYLATEEGGDVGAGVSRDTVGFILIHKF